jgi:integral membrane protein
MLGSRRSISRNLTPIFASSAAPRVKNPVLTLRALALAEGCSFLLLVGIAMPLKYFVGQPAAVKVFGWIHGILFILLCGALLRTTVAARWPLPRAALIFLAALLPFGPFVVDRRMKEYAAEFVSRQ